MKKNLTSFLLVIAITVLAGIVVFPRGPELASKEIKMHLGLDLQGGVQIVYEIDETGIGDRPIAQVQSETIDLIRRRVD
ncbi:MAG: hypothetical protein ABH810_02195, partial [bacterium]